MSTWVLAPPPPTAEVKSPSSYFFFPYTARIFSSPISPREIKGNGRREDALMSFEARFPTQTNKKRDNPPRLNPISRIICFPTLFPANMSNIKSTIILIINNGCTKFFTNDNNIIEKRYNPLFLTHSQHDLLASTSIPMIKKSKLHIISLKNMH